jgi:hypothetical protein
MLGGGLVLQLDDGTEIVLPSGLSTYEATA